MIDKQLLVFVQNLFIKYKYIGIWWPGESRVEIIISAVLTQLSNRQQVAKVLGKLKNRLKDFEGISQKIFGYNCNINLDWNIERQLAKFRLKYLKQEDLRGVGFYKRKYYTIKELLKWFLYSDLKVSILALRKQLLCIKGIGKETADAILCYGLDKPSFVIDFYTYKVLYENIFKRYYRDFRLFKKDYSYDNLKNIIESILKDLNKDNIFWYKNLHGAFVEEGKKLNQNRR